MPGAELYIGRGDILYTTLYRLLIKLGMGLSLGLYSSGWDWFGVVVRFGNGVKVIICSVLRLRLW